MNRIIVTCLISLICISSISCQKKEEAAKEEKPVLQASDVAKALGMSWWYVQLPDGLTINDKVGLAYKLPDGSIESQCESSTLKWGSIVKVFLWRSEGSSRYQFAVLSDNFSAKGSLDEKSNMTSSCTCFPQDKKLKVGDVLIKFYDKTGTGSPEIQPGELGLILYVKKSNENTDKEAS